MSHKSEQISKLEVLNVFLGMQTSPVAWASFMESQG